MLVNPELGGVTLGWHLTSTAADELFAAIEGTAFHTRIILERMQKHGVPWTASSMAAEFRRRNDMLNQVYANVLEQADSGAARGCDQFGLGDFRIFGGRRLPFD